MSKQSKMLKADILKILSKDISGGSNTRPAFEDAKSPNTFFGGADNQPFYPLAQEPAPSANPASPIVPGIVVLEPGQKSGKRPTYKKAKTPLTFFGGAKECKDAKAAAKIVCADEKKQKKKRAPSKYNVFVKDFFSKNKNLGKDRMKIVAAAWKKSQSGAPAAKKAPRPKINMTSFGEVPPPPPAGPPPAKAKKGGRKPNPGKPLPEKQLQSFAKKEPSKPKTKKNSAWMAHLAEFRKANPSVKPKDVMKMAKMTYKKGGAHCGGAQNHCNAPPPIDGDQIGVGGAVIKPDIKMTEETHTMPDGTIMPGKTHGGEMVLPGQVRQLMVEKKAGDLPVASEKLPEKSKQDQTQIMVDIMNSYDTFNKRFQDVSNSTASLENKRSQYNSERDRIDKFHVLTLQNYGESLSEDNKRIEEKAYRYALETYKIGIESLTTGAPQQRVEFENFDDNDTITKIIDKALSVPRSALDRARSFFSVPIKNQPIQTFNPVIPALGRMASAYPYGYQQKEKAMRGGKAKRTPKQMLTRLTRDLFIREMGKKYPEIPTKKIIAAYDKNKGDIRAIVTDMIIDAIEIKGGAAACGPDEYASGDRCFKKQARPDTFDRDKFFADQKREADSKERRDDGMVKQNDAPDINVDMSTKRTADAAMPMPTPKPQDKNEKGFVEKFSASITPPDSGPIFGTDGQNISDPRDWVDTLANIFVGTASGVSTIFDALGDLF